MHKLGDLHSVDALSDREVITAITEITHAHNAAAAQKFSLLVQFARRGLNVASGHSSPAHYIAAGTRVALSNATRQFDTAAWLSEWPSVLQALADSDIFVDHVREIYEGYRVIRTADPRLSRDRIAAAVADLLAAAVDGTATAVKHRAQVLAHAAADDARARYERALRERRQQEERDHERGEPRPEPNTEPTTEPAPSDVDDLVNGPAPQPVSENPGLNRLDLFLQPNGRTSFKGDVDKVLAEKLRASLSPLSRPQPAADGTLDPRSTSLRQADALSHLLDQHTDRRGPAGKGASPSNVNVTVNLKDLLADSLSPTDGLNSHSSSTATQPGTEGRGAKSSGATRMRAKGNRTGIDDGSAQDLSPVPSMDHPDWPFRMEWTGPISRSLARLLACDADLNPIVVDDNGVPLAMGRTVRLATPEQRVAVTVRDRCCVKCGMPAQWCQVHHIVFWREGGPTDIGNLVLVCGDCHRLVHNYGWGIEIGADGHPVILPPSTIDPERKPIPSFHRRRRPAA